MEPEENSIEDWIEAEGKIEVKKEPNGFEFQPVLQKLDALMAGPLDSPLEADAFMDVDIISDGQKLPHAKMTLSEQYVPVKLRLDIQDGRLVFWFYRHDPDKDQFAQDYKTLYGVCWRDLSDVFPDYAAEIEKDLGRKIGALERKNIKLMGSRRRIIETMNNSLESRSLAAELEREKNIEALRQSFYKSGEDTGMF